MSRQYESYIQQQLEPEQVCRGNAKLYRGNAKLYREIVIGDRTFRIGEPPYNPLAYTKPAAIQVDFEAAERQEDEFLKNHGI